MAEDIFSERLMELAGQVAFLRGDIKSIHDSIKGNGREGIEARIVRIEENFCRASESQTRLYQIVADLDPRLARVELSLEKFSEQLCEHAHGAKGPHESQRQWQGKARELWYTTIGRVVAGVAGGLAVLLASRYL